jgi:hypothetical protein
MHLQLFLPQHCDLGLRVLRSLPALGSSGLHVNVSVIPLLVLWYQCVCSLQTLKQGQLVVL